MMFSEMVEAMKKVAKLDLELTVEERNLLSVAYKNVIGARRASWRIISSIEQKEEAKGADDKLEMIRQYRQQVKALIKMELIVYTLYWISVAWWNVLMVSVCVNNLINLCFDKKRLFPTVNRTGWIEMFDTWRMLVQIRTITFNSYFQAFFVVHVLSNFIEKYGSTDWRVIKYVSYKNELNNLFKNHQNSYTELLNKRYDLLSNSLDFKWTCYLQ